MKSIINTCALALALGPAAAFPDDRGDPWGTPLEQRIVALLAAVTNATRSLEVSCPGGSIPQALSRAVRSAPLVITVKGRCAGPVLIDRDDVTLQGATRADGIDGELRIVGAHRVTVRNMTVENLDGTAVNIREGASATLADVTAVGDNLSAPNSGNDGYGVAITRQAFAQLDRVDAKVLSGGNNALLLTDGGTARSRDGSYVSESLTRFDNTAIGLYRQASLRMDGTPVIENNNGLDQQQPFESLAVQVLHTSNFRIHNDLAHIRGNIHVGNNSAASLRRVGSPGVGPGTIEGNVTVNGDSHLQITTRAAATVTEYVLVDDQSMLTLQGPPGSIDAQGGLFCVGPNLDGAVRNPGTLTQFPQFSGCSLF